MDFSNHLTSVGNATIKSLPTPSADGDAANKAYVDSAIEGLAWKDSVRAASTANLDVSSPGASIDGVTLAQYDRVLLKDQSTGAQNGIYLFDSASTPLTRAADASTSAELEQAVVTVEEGTANAGTTWRQSVVNFTLGSTAQTWASFGTVVASASESTAGKIEIATQSETDTGTDDARAITPLKLATWSGRPLRYAATFGDGSNTSYTVTHNLGSEDVVVSVRYAASTKDAVLADWRVSSSNAIILTFATAPASNSLRVVVLA